MKPPLWAIGLSSPAVALRQPIREGSLRRHLLRFQVFLSDPRIILEPPELVDYAVDALPELVRDRELHDLADRF
jgi:hypothetical protein